MEVLNGFRTENINFQDQYVEFFQGFVCRGLALLRWLHNFTVLEKILCDDFIYRLAFLFLRVMLTKRFLQKPLSKHICSLGAPSYLLDTVYSFLLFISSAQKACG